MWGDAMKNFVLFWVVAVLSFYTFGATEVVDGIEWHYVIIKALLQ